MIKGLSDRMLVGSRAGAALACAVLADVALLVLLRAAEVTGPAELVAQVALVIGFGALAVVDLRAAVALAILELALGGASGQWTVMPAGITGRMAIDVVLGAVAALRLGQAWRRGDGLHLGRYGLHALLLAVLIPAIWVPIGVLTGSRLGDALADGDGYLFLSFAVVLAAAALVGDLGWLRRWVLVACVAVAVLHVVLLLVIVAGIASPEAVNTLLVERFHFGGAIGFTAANGVRVYIAAGLFLQVGVVLVAWEIVGQPRRWWPWLSVALLIVALVVTYTRGYWLGAALGAGMVLAVARPEYQRRAIVAVGAACLVLGVGAWLRFPPATYIVDRTVSSAIGLPIGPDLGDDPTGGGLSNAVKLDQARILLGHIAERPLLGWGFGAIAPDYPYSDTYTYELTYLDRTFKTGIVGLLLFLSFPVRLLIDGVRVMRGRLRGPPGMPTREAVVPLAILASVLAVGATNPYLAGSVGLGALVLCICWLDPFGW